MTAYGVSPAFVFSRHGTGYTCADYCASLPVMRRLGFSAFQPEIHRAEAVEEWAGGGAVRVAATARDLGLRASQFVAHFFMHGLASAARLADHADLDLLKRTVEAARCFDGCEVLTVPIARFQPGVSLNGHASHAALSAALRDKVGAALEWVRQANLRLALEVLPYSLLANADGFLRLAAEIGSPHLGVNLDTGHAWAMREVMELLPSKLKGRVFGVHLKDNNSDVNRPLAPGKGTIPWAAVLRGLRAAGYAGSWDVEIGCPPERVEAEYRDGLDYLKSLNIA